MNPWIVAIGWVLASACASAAQRVDIGDAGHLARLRSESPATYAKVERILRIAGDVSCETLPRILKVEFDAKDARCAGAGILTSYPAKRRIAFELDGALFSGNIVLTGKPATLQRAKPVAPRPSTPP